MSSSTWSGIVSGEHLDLPPRGHGVLEPSEDSFEGSKRQTGQCPSFTDAGGTDHHFFEHKRGRRANVDAGHLP